MTTTAEPVAPEEGVVLHRRTIDTVLTAIGALLTVVFIVAGALLWWGQGFAADYVHDELSSQNIFFPDAASLTDQGRDDLVEYADQQVTTGAHAEAYASFIDGHLQGIADGQTYADLSAPESEARAALEDAQESGADEDTIAELQATYDEVSTQRNTLFKGETLRGLLLSAYAWSTVGMVAKWAALAAWLAAAVMAILTVLGLRHRHRVTTA